MHRRQGEQKPRMQGRQGEPKPRKHSRQGTGEPKLKHEQTNMYALNNIVYNTSINETNIENHWDQETYPIAIDSCCSVSITKNKEDFTGELQKCNVTIQGFNGSTKIKFKGTWKFRIEDQQGTVHSVMIPNTLYAPNA